MKIVLEGKFSEISNFVDSRLIKNESNADPDLKITIEIATPGLQAEVSLPKLASTKNNLISYSTPQKSYWAQFTPEERSKIMKARRRVAKKNKKNRNKKKLLKGWA